MYLTIPLISFLRESSCLSLYFVYLGRGFKSLHLHRVLAHDDFCQVVERHQHHGHKRAHRQAELPLVVYRHANGNEDSVD